MIMSNKTAKEIREERLELYKTDPESNKQLPLIADEIRARVRNIKRQMFEIGQLLTEAKVFMEHGKFKDWIRDQKFDFSYQTANNIMRVYRYCLRRPQLIQSIPSSVLYTIAAPGFPKDLREFIFKNADDLEKISNKKIRDLCRRFKDKELDLESPEIEGLIKYRQDRNQYQAYLAKLEEAIGMLEHLGKNISKVSADITWPIFPGEEQTVLTAEQAQKVKDLIEDLGEQVKGLKPDYVVKRLKPRLVVSED
jgi:hypothetical protein